MKPEFSAEKISYDDFQDKLRFYSDHVPAKIQGLEELRLNEVPQVLSQRKKDGTTFLEKTEVTGLVEWKLKHGTYRPKLAKLVAENTDAEIKKTTKEAFAMYETDNEDASKAVTAMSKLKGVGPATASLFLSCYDPVKVPFFSDELFRYLHWTENKSKRWDRKISYTMKEYKTLLEKTQGLRDRLEKESGKPVKAIDLEKMAYGLAREAQTGTKRSNEEEHEEALRPSSPKRRRKPTLEPS